mmetsp:Transcript_5502/g.13775  ORF Transcript_5502/g.13775 Transcript_5502/m.13775 type:complete len:120 (-) Transcript_5502:458-817(-)
MRRERARQTKGAGAAAAALEVVEVVLLGVGLVLPHQPHQRTLKKAANMIMIDHLKRPNTSIIWSVVRHQRLTLLTLMQLLVRTILTTTLFNPTTSRTSVCSIVPWEKPIKKAAESSSKP